MILNLFFLAMLVCGPVSLVGSHPESTFTCPSKLVSSARLLLNSYRNDKGKWESQIRLTHAGGPLVLNETVPWSVVVEHNVTATCQKGEEITILATLSSPDGTTCEHFYNSSGPVQVKIPKDYELFPGVGYYKFHPYGATWGDARKICADEGAHLIIINSENEGNVLKTIFARFPKEKLTNAPEYNSCWVGVYEQGANGQYFTIFGDDLNTTGFTRWYPGRPANAGTDECVFAHRTNSGLWDNICSSLAPFLCEFQT